MAYATATVAGGPPFKTSSSANLHDGGFLQTRHNAMFVGGTGTGKTHICIVITASCGRCSARPLLHVIDLVNWLEAETRVGQASKTTLQIPIDRIHAPGIVRLITVPPRPNSHR